MKYIKDFNDFINEKKSINEMSTNKRMIFTKWLKEKIAEDHLDIEEESAIIAVVNELGCDIDKKWIKQNGKKSTKF